MKYYHILPAILLICATSCEKELDFKYHDIEPLTVIEAELTSEGAKVGLTLTTPMDEPMDRNRLTDACVTLTDLTDGSSVILDSDADGYYINPTPGIASHEYGLSVERAGRLYEAKTAMYSPTEIISLDFNWINMPYDRVAVLQTKFTENPAIAGEYFWMKIYRNGEIYEWVELDDRSAVDGVRTIVSMMSREDTEEEDDDKVLLDGDVVTVSITPISRSMHDYLEALQNGNNGPALFSGEKVLGYFIASSPVSKSVVFHPDEIPEYK